MTNWENEANRLVNQEQLEIKSRLEKTKLGNTVRENQIQDLVRSNYEKIVIPGFEILDKFKIKETLTEIRDQIWGGEIYKEPIFQDYFNNIIKNEDSYHKIIQKEKYPEKIKENDFLVQFNLNDEEKEKINTECNNYSATYILKSPKIIAVNWYHDDEYNSEVYDLIETNEILKITSNGNNINIGYICIDKIKDTDPLKIKEMINDSLVKECFNYKLRRKDAVEKQEKESKSKIITPPKRSFLDKLFG